MDRNPFADLIPAAASGPNPFDDLIPQAKPAAPMSGWSPEQVEELNQRQPRVEQRPSLGGAVSQAFTEASEDPVGALARSVGKITGSNKLARDVYALPQSLGPLGAVEFGFAAPRAPRPLQTSGAMPKASVRTQAELKSSGGANIQTAKQSEEVVGAEDMQASLAKFDEELNARALEIDADLHPTAAKVMTKVRDAAATPQSLRHLHALRQKVQTVIENGVNTRTGKPNQEGLIGQKMKSAVDEMIAKHPEGTRFKQGTSEYARAEKSAIIENAIENAKLTSQWNSGNQAGALRNALKSIYKKHLNLWTPTEKTAIRKIARHGLLDVAGGFASTGPMGFTLGRVVEAIVGLPPMTGYAVSVPARMINNARKLKAAENISERIRAGGEIEKGRVARLSSLLSPSVFYHVVKDAEGARRVQAWITSPSAQTARALSTYTAAKLKVPEMALRIAEELQGTGQSEAQPNQQQ